MLTQTREWLRKRKAVLVKHWYHKLGFVRRSLAFPSACQGGTQSAAPITSSLRAHWSIRVWRFLRFLLLCLLACLLAFSWNLAWVKTLVRVHRMFLLLFFSFVSSYLDKDRGFERRMCWRWCAFCTASHQGLVRTRTYCRAVGLGPVPAWYRSRVFIIQSMLTFRYFLQLNHSWANKLQEKGYWVLL